MRSTTQVAQAGTLDLTQQLPFTFPLFLPCTSLWRNEVVQQTNVSNHLVDGVEAEVDKDACRDRDACRHSSRNNRQLCEASIIRK